MPQNTGKIVKCIGALLWRRASRRLIVSVLIACTGAGAWHWLIRSSPQTARAATVAVAKQKPEAKLKLRPALKSPAVNAPVAKPPPANDTVAKEPVAQASPAEKTIAKAPLAKTSAKKSVARRVTSATTTTTRPAVTQRAPAQLPPALGPLYIDDVHGFAMRFPASWRIHTFAGEPWILDCGNARVGLITIGFSPCLPEVTVDNLIPEAIAKRIQKRTNTTLHAQGRAQIAGLGALWSKSTGPMPMTNAAPLMTRVQYIVPLGDGRVLELRVAAPPEQFDAVAGVMKQSLGTFRVTARPAGSPSLAAAISR